MQQCEVNILKFSPYPKTVVLRHAKENLKKCSLKGLEIREDFVFYTYPKEKLPPLKDYIHFTLEAPPLEEEDWGRGFFFVDGTWRLAIQMEKYLEREGFSFVKRSLPGQFRTAYPRVQSGCLDPERGLATVEAIWLAYHLSGRSAEGLLDYYYWKDNFINSLTFN